MMEPKTFFKSDNFAERSISLYFLSCIKSNRARNKGLSSDLAKFEFQPILPYGFFECRTVIAPALGPNTINHSIQCNQSNHRLGAVSNERKQTFGKFGKLFVLKLPFFEMLSSL